MSDVEPEESGLASGVVNTAFMMGGALGLAVLASLAARRTEHADRRRARPAGRADGRLPRRVPGGRGVRAGRRRAWRPPAAAGDAGRQPSRRAAGRGARARPGGRGVRDCPIDPEVKRSSHERCCWSGPARAASCSRATATAATGTMRGPYCEGWPVYHAVLRRRAPARSTRRPRASGTARPSGAATTSARPGTLSSEGLAYGEDERRSSRRSRASPPRTAACSSASRRRASSRAATAARPGRCSSTLAGQPGSEDWDDPANQPPGHLGISGDASPDPDDPARFWAIVQGIGIFETDRRRRVVDAAQPRACAPTGRASTRRSASACTSSCARRPTATGMYQQNHVRHAPQRRRRPLVDRDHRGPADRVRLRGGGAPARPRHAST